ncbi:MAG: C2 family cysteine protease [Oscillospiraceae bacterium]|nr:C2 family cysteine protease [Oscillospiraceae bacterium]
MTTQESYFNKKIEIMTEQEQKEIREREVLRTVNSENAFKVLGEGTPLNETAQVVTEQLQNLGNVPVEGNAPPVQVEQQPQEQELGQKERKKLEKRRAQEQQNQEKVERERQRQMEMLQAVADKEIDTRAEAFIDGEIKKGKAANREGLMKAYVYQPVVKELDFYRAIILNDITDKGDAAKLLDQLTEYQHHAKLFDEKIFMMKIRENRKADISLDPNVPAAVKRLVRNKVFNEAIEIQENIRPQMVKLLDKIEGDIKEKLGLPEEENLLDNPKYKYSKKDETLKEFNDAVIAKMKTDDKLTKIQATRLVERERLDFKHANHGQEIRGNDITLHHGEINWVKMGEDTPLFGENGVNISDVKQGSHSKCGDCFLLSTLASFANSRDKARSVITDAITDNGDTVTVRFFDDDKPVFITVDKSLPINDKTNRNHSLFSQGAPWVVMFEKAYMLYRNTKVLKPNIYEHLDVGATSELAMMLLTGKPADTVYLADYRNGENDEKALCDRIHEALSSGRAVTYGNENQHNVAVIAVGQTESGYKIIMRDSQHMTKDALENDGVQEFELSALETTTTFTIEKAVETQVPVQEEEKKQEEKKIPDWVNPQWSPERQVLEMDLKALLDKHKVANLKEKAVLSQELRELNDKLTKERLKDPNIDKEFDEYEQRLKSKFAKYAETDTESEYAAVYDKLKGVKLDVANIGRLNKFLKNIYGDKNFTGKAAERQSENFEKYKDIADKIVSEYIDLINIQNKQKNISGVIDGDERHNGVWLSAAYRAKRMSPANTSERMLLLENALSYLMFEKHDVKVDEFDEDTDKLRTKEEHLILEQDFGFKTRYRKFVGEEDDAETIENVRKTKEKFELSRDTAIKQMLELEERLSKTPIQEQKQEVPVQEVKQEVPVQEQKQEVPVQEEKQKQEVPVQEQKQEVPVQEVPVQQENMQQTLYTSEQAQEKARTLGLSQKSVTSIRLFMDRYVNLDKGSAEVAEKYKGMLNRIIDEFMAVLKKYEDDPTLKGKVGELNQLRRFAAYFFKPNYSAVDFTMRDEGNLSEEGRDHEVLFEKFGYVTSSFSFKQEEEEKERLRREEEERVRDEVKKQETPYNMEQVKVIAEAAGLRGFISATHVNNVVNFVRDYVNLDKHPESAEIAVKYKDMLNRIIDEVIRVVKEYRYRLDGGGEGELNQLKRFANYFFKPNLKNADSTERDESELSESVKDGDVLVLFEKFGYEEPKLKVRLEDERKVEKANQEAEEYLRSIGYDNLESKNYYQLLGLPVNEKGSPGDVTETILEDIRKNYKKIVFKLHPDQVERIAIPADVDRGAYVEKIQDVFKLVSNAYKVLIDEEQRIWYNIDKFKTTQLGTVGGPVAKPEQEPEQKPEQKPLEIGWL